MVIDMAAMASILMPANCLPVATEEVARTHALDRQIMDRFGIRVDIERVHRAVELAHEARLASILAQDKGWARRHGLEYIGRADLDAEIAAGASVAIENLDHNFRSLLVNARIDRLSADSDFVEAAEDEAVMLDGILVGKIVAPVHATRLCAR